MQGVAIALAPHGVRRQRLQLRVEQGRPEGVRPESLETIRHVDMGSRVQNRHADRFDGRAAEGQNTKLGMKETGFLSPMHKPRAGRYAVIRA